MTSITLFFGTLYGLLAVIFGAFGAHALKKTRTLEQLKSFETAVKYQMYHAILLLVIGFNLEENTPLFTYISYFLIVGIFLFSFSIYGLLLSDAKGKKIRLLGPITPIGGLLLVIGWSMLLITFIK